MVNNFLDFLLDNEVSEIKSEKLTLEKGDKLVLNNSGEKISYVFGISKGTVAINKNTTILDFLGSNQILGLHVGSADSLQGEVISKKAIVWKFELQDVMMKIENNKIGLELYNEYTLGVQNSLVEKISTMKLDSTKNVCRSLRTLALQFGEVSEDSFVRLPEYFTKKILSSYTGIKTSTLTSTLKKLDEDGQIIYGRRVLLVRI